MKGSKGCCLLGHFIVHLGIFKEYQFISVYFLLLPMNRSEKLNYLKQSPDFLKINTDKNEFYVTRQDVLSSAKWHAIADDRLSDCHKVVHC